MFNIYVTNKSLQSVYIRLQHKKLSASKPSFYHELDKTKGNATRHLVQYGFCLITRCQTIPFPTDQAINGTRMYASLYAVSSLWIMDFEINCTRYGCLFIKSEGSDHKPTFHLYQANPEPAWIPAKRGDRLPSNIVKASPQNYFGRRSTNEGTPCKVTIGCRGTITICDAMTDLAEYNKCELLCDTGHEFVRAKAGDGVPPNGVISGVSAPEGSLYLGRTGGNMPCSISTEGGKIKYFLYGTKKVQSGEILVLTV